MFQRVAVGLAATVLFVLSVAGPSPARADRMQLWQIVRLKCMRHLAKAEAAIPCEYVDLSAGDERGVAVLKNFVGVGGMLAIPTGRVTGIEDPQVLADGSPNYFASAWLARARVEFRLRHPAPREAISIAVDSKPARDQDQLSLVVDCLDKSVAASLRDYAGLMDDRWRPMSVELKGRRYWARRVASADFTDVAPFRLLAEGIPGAKDDMADWSIAAIGATFNEKRSFLLLANKTEANAGGRASDLQDRDCAIASSPM